MMSKCQSRQRWGAVFIASIGLLGAAFAAPAGAQGASQPTEGALREIAGLIAEKNARTPTQQKIDSQLLYAANQARTGVASSAAPGLRVDGIADAQGRVEVEVRGVADAAMASLVRAQGGIVVRQFAQSRTTEAIVPLLRLEALANDDRVTSIRPLSPVQAPNPPRPSGATDPKALAGTGAGMLLDAASAKDSGTVLTPRLARFRDTVAKALAAHEATLESQVEAAKRAKIGSATAQGDRAHRTRDVRNNFGLNGAGLRIGVLSDSFNNLGAYAADIASGDLPGPGNPFGYTTPVRFAGSGDLPSGGSDEGRAMLQIVHDLAPGAELYYANAFNSQADFANNIRALRGIAAAAPPFGNITPGCDIIIDDIFYFIESGLHEGQPASVVSSDGIAEITQAVNDVTADGAIYFSSAGNSGGVTQGSAGAWEGDFVPGTTLTIPGEPAPAEVLDFDPTAAVSASNGITASAIPVMHWSDPIGGAANDYDFFVLNAALTTVVRTSTNVQNGTQDPVEPIFFNVPSGNRLVVVRRGTAQPRYISITTNRGRLQFATSGQVRGHSIAPRAYAVSATPAAATFGPPTPNGPFPGPFVGTNQVEPFNSDGPRRVFFNVDNQAITPNNFLAGTGGGAVRQKPDITAADGVATTLPPGSGLNPFYGTSAAAPHAGAIAALAKQASPGLTPSLLRVAFNATALDIMAPGVDRDAGVGVIQAFELISLFKPATVATLETGAVTATRVGTPGPIDAGSSAEIVVQLANVGGAGASAISATLVSDTPCVTVTGASADYANLAAGASGNNATPFTIALSPLCLCPLTINLTLTVNYAGGTQASARFPLRIDTRETLVINETLDAAAPAANPAYVGVNTTQTGRLNRFTPQSECGVAEAFPGLAATTGVRNVDTYTFPSVTAARCLGITLQDLTGTTAKLFTAAYAGPYPANLTTGWLGDSGSSPPGGGAALAYSVAVPASVAPVIAVHEVNPGGAPNNAYRLTVSGLNSCLFNFASVIPPGSAAATETGDGDAFIEPCESGALAIQVANRGGVPATAVTGTITSTTPGITITGGTMAYPDIPQGGSATNAMPFTFDAGAAMVCGTIANFNLALQFAGGAAGGSPVSIPFSVRIGANPQLAFTDGTGGVVPAGGTLVPNTAADDAVGTVATPFPIALYATQVAAGANVSVSTNGNVQLVGSAASSAFTNTALPAAGFPAAPTLFAYWDDLDLSAGGVFSLVEGSAGARTWTLIWRGVTFNGANPVEFAVRFRENTSDIEYLYNNSAAASGGSATIGVQAASSGTLFTQRAFNLATAVAPGTVFTARASACNACPSIFSDGFEPTPTR